MIHFKTHLAVFLVDIKMADIERAPNMVAQYLFNLYADDPDMQKALGKYFESSPIAALTREQTEAL